MEEWEINIDYVVRDIGGISPEQVTSLIEDSSKVITSSAVFNMKAALIVHPSYVAPAAVLSSTQSSAGLEIGQAVDIPLTVAFTQNDAGAASGTVIKKDSTQISALSSYTDSAVVMSATPKVYQGVVSYAQGPVKNNNFGDADSTGQIASGTVNSNTLSYRGYYKYFFGPVASNPSNSAAVRALSSQIETNGTVILNTGTTQVNFAFWIPATHSLVSVLDLEVFGGTDITANYTLVDASFSVNDAAGTPVTGKLYVLTQAITNTTSHRHQIIIS